MSAIPPKIQSFFDNGFLPGGGDLDVARSFDRKPRGQVSLNCISKIKGAAISLLHPAKGGLAVMVEKRVGEGGFLDDALLRNSNLIRRKEVEFAKISPSPATAAARRFALQRDSEFLEAIAKQIHHTALFVLNIEPDSDENVSIDGCKEVGRPRISGESIHKVLISEKELEKCFHDRFVPISPMGRTITISGVSILDA